MQQDRLKRLRGRRRARTACLIVLGGGIAWLAQVRPAHAQHAGGSAPSSPVTMEAQRARRGASPRSRFSRTVSAMSSALWPVQGGEVQY